MHRSREEIEALKAVQVYFILTKLGTFETPSLRSYKFLYFKSSSPSLRAVPRAEAHWQAGSLYYDLR